MPPRTTGLKRTALKPSTTPMARSPINPRSAKMKAVAPEHDPIRVQVFARDGHRCILAGKGFGSCFPGPSVLTPHHLRKSGQGGAYVPDNLVTLCPHHNDDFAETDSRAWALGLVCRNGEDVLSCWARMRAAGLVKS